MRHFLIVEETRIHYKTPETKQQLEQRVSRVEYVPKLDKVVLATTKVLKTVFEIHTV